MNDKDFQSSAPNYRVVLWLSFILIVAVAGIRFSDGSMLLAISRGLTIGDPVFKDAATQYVWDSPLKIALLYILPAKIFIIAVVFGVLGFLPLLGLFSNDIRLFWLTFVGIFFTPAFKVSIQNLGVGDGLILFLIVLISASRNYLSIAGAFFLIALWHPQQSFFIGTSYLLATYCYKGKFERQGVLAVLGPLSIAFFVFLLYKSSLGFTYSSRAAFISEHIRDYLQRNLIYAPIAFTPIIAWLLLSGVRASRAGALLVLWLFILVVVSMLTTDVTRAMTIVSLPIVLMGAKKVMTDGVAVPHWKFIVGTTLIVVIPPYSWSGLDYFLWPDLVNDLCKWGFYCQ